MSSGRLAIGAVAGAHGVKGQFKVKPFTAAPRDIATYGPVWAGDRQLTLSVMGMTANGMVIVGAAEIGDRDSAAALRGTELQVDRAAFPDACIVHTNRDPMAVCWSNYQRYFPAKGMNFGNDLETLGRYYKRYVDLMGFWRKKFGETIYELDSDRLTKNQEVETRALAFVQRILAVLCSSNVVVR